MELLKIIIDSSEIIFHEKKSDDCIYTEIEDNTDGSCVGAFISTEEAQQIIDFLQKQINT